MKDFSAFLDLRRYKSRAHKVGSWIYLTVPGLFCVSHRLRPHPGPHSCSTPELLQGLSKVRGHSGPRFNPRRGGSQASMCEHVGDKATWAWAPAALSCPGPSRKAHGVVLAWTYEKTI